MDFFFLETETSPIDAAAEAAVSKFFKVNKISCKDPTGLKTVGAKKPEETIVFVPVDAFAEPEVVALLEPFQTLGHVVWIDGADTNASSVSGKDLASEIVARILAQIFSETRTVGIKCFLEKGAKIYSESIFDTGVLGAKLDPCHKLARKRLGAAVALKAWAAVEAVILAAFQYLPGNGDGSTGERVDLQIGSDEQVFTIGVRFEQAADSLSALLSHSALVIAREQCHILEAREIRAAKKVEINMVFFRSAPATSVRIVHQVQEAALEKTEDAAAYSFKPMDAIEREGDAPVERKIKGGFKKKFSEQVKQISGDKNVLDETRIKGDAPEKEVTRVVKGSAPMDAKLAELLQPVVINGPKDKTAAFLEAKIIGLQEALRERDGVVQRLSKEITEIKDPLKMNVISNIQDNQKQGLQDKIKSLNEELEESKTREKELMTLVDKAVVMRDEAMKKIKELELKSRQASGGNNSKIVMLEKQLEEAARQRKEMSQRINELMEQLRGKAA